MSHFEDHAIAHLPESRHNDAQQKRVSLLASRETEAFVEHDDKRRPTEGRPDEGRGDLKLDGRCFHREGGNPSNEPSVDEKEQCPHVCHCELVQSSEAVHGEDELNPRHEADKQLRYENVQRRAVKSTTWHLVMASVFKKLNVAFSFFVPLFNNGATANWEAVHLISH